MVCRNFIKWGLINYSKQVLDIIRFFIMPGIDSQVVGDKLKESNFKISIKEIDTVA